MITKINLPINVVYLLRAYYVRGVSLGPGSTVVNLTDNSLLSTEFRRRTESMLSITKQIIPSLVSVVFNWVLISTMEIMLGNINHLKSKKEESKVAQLFCSPMDCSPPGSSIRGIF